MRREICLERVYDETRLALLEDGRLCMYLSERDSGASLSGNIYLGRVRNILPGMNAAFVDIGTGRNAYLAAQDAGADRIEKLLKPGQAVLCQVDKEPGGSKGPRVTMNLSLAGRRLVCLPGQRDAGVSKKIEDETERERLYTVAKSLSEEFGAGVILRTACEGCAYDEIREEYLSLLEAWRPVHEKSRYLSAPTLLRADGDLCLYAVRELLREDTDALRTDDEALFARLKSYAEALTPQLADRVTYHKCETPLFDLLRVDRQLENALDRRVDLKSGGTLVIDECEAMTVIDVNTAKFTGRGSLEETLFEINLEAAKEIARQIRLRDLGGIIVVDFIDMNQKEHREALLESLKELFASDANRTTVHGFTQLNLVELSRKKLRRPLSKRETRDCPVCGGQGRIPRDEALALRAARELYVRRRRGDDSHYRLTISPRLAEHLPEALKNGDERLSIRIVPSENSYSIAPCARSDTKDEAL